MSAQPHSLANVEWTASGGKLGPSQTGRTVMLPHSLQKWVTTKLSASQKLAALGPIAARHGRIAKGAVLPETQARACPRVKVADLPEGWLNQRHIDRLEQNQLIASCCRHPENHEVEAFKSHIEEEGADIYIFHCTCGRKHRFFCVGDSDRPMWGAG